MRQLPRTACAYLVGFLIAAASVPAFASDTGFTIDLMAPSTACVGSKCPSDINLPELGAVANASDVQMGGTSSQVTLDSAMAQPIVCSEASNASPPYSYGAVGSYQISPVFNNAYTNAVFEFDSGGPSIVDASKVSNDGIVFATTQSNSATSQVACYPIEPLGAATPLYANSTVSGDRVFYNGLEGGHAVGEPWVSVVTVASPPSDTGHRLGYVMQIHNASTAVDWHLSFGYDHAFFSAAANSGFAPKWCVLATPQPGPVDITGALCAPVTSIHMITAADIQSATNSVYVFVQNFGSGTAVSSWPSLPITFYPASGAVFSQPGVYAQRIDDKVAVAGANNVPVQNVGNIVCANDPAATTCSVFDQDGNPLPVSVTFANQVSSGAVTIDPVAYVVDPTAMKTLPATTTALAAPTNVSCNDPNGIFASQVGQSNFATSTHAQGAQAFNFNFAPSGALYVPGTASCTATFSANGLSSTQSFTVTMQQLTVTKFVVTADATATAGSPANFTVTAKDGANNTVPGYAGTVAFTSSDAQAVLPANSMLTNGVGSFSGTLKTAGSQTFTATDTVTSTIHGTSNNVTVSAAAVATLAVDISTPAPVGFATVMHVNPHDQYGNSVTGYTGTLHFTSTDGAATLPPDGAFTNGFYNNVTFNTTGPQTVTATDTGTSSITGTSNSVNVTP